MFPFVQHLVLGCLIGLLIALVAMRWVLGWLTPKELAWHLQDLERLRLHCEASRALAQRLVYASTVRGESLFLTDDPRVGVVREGHLLLVPCADQAVHPTSDWERRVKEDVPGFQFRFERGSLVLIQADGSSSHFGSSHLAFRLASSTWESGVRRFAQS